MAIASILTLFYLQNMKYKAIAKGKADKITLKSEHNIIDRKFTQLEKNIDKISSEQYDFEDRKLSRKYVDLIRKHPPYYHTINKCNNILISQFALVILAICLPFCNKSKRHS